MGMVRQWQELMHGNRLSESYMDSLPDFVKLAESFGVAGLRAEKPSDLDSLIKEMLKIKGPVICDIVVDPNEKIVFPMIPSVQLMIKCCSVPRMNLMEKYQRRVWFWYNPYYE